ncbi:NACHT domain-containing protein [Arthrobacter sp. UNC362MFTsu5.1]|uniref:NACHT domain-containing protein n=1 Tax=Arthrobacter sp. UNC362MFTsu5.1 TaxID=1449044 RepID=UPI0018CC49EB|nr:NACHT domain-containing protein [Arthrobacter sp. UNC362MFTsu5.1]
MEFEREVLRLARLLYPGDPSGGATKIDGQERDGIFVTEDLVVAIEATTSPRKDKAEKDGKKLKALASQLATQYPFKAIKCFFVTQEEPTADQRDAIKRLGTPLAAVGFDDLRSRLIDVRSYLSARGDHEFGSARDPETDDKRVTDKYVELDFVDSASKATIGVSDLYRMMQDGRQVVLIGDYGTGKSMTLREIYLRFRKDYFNKVTTKFALHLNLNDHQGQSDPSEALIRHANLIGFSQPHQLVRAWKSGEAHIILDGFDEIFGSGGAGRPIAEVREKSVELVRTFSRKTPREAGLLIAGREHFFDSTQELRRALGLRPEVTIASASEFTEDQVRAYLQQRNWLKELPSWLPRRPLIVGYLAGHRLFDLVDDIGSVDSGEGWHRLIQAVCAREARIEAGLNEDAIRSMLEKLATLARKTSSGLGPLQFEDLITAFRDLRGYLPDEGAYGVLQRLPGLRVSDGRTNSRSFVDDDFVDAARAGDIYNFILNPYQPNFGDAFTGAQTLLGEVGLAVLGYRVNGASLSEGAITTSLTKAQSIARTEIVQADILRLILSQGMSPQRAITINDQHIPSLRVTDGADCSSVEFSNCIIEVLDLSGLEYAGDIPRFTECIIERIDGIAALDELTTERIVASEIGDFSESSETMAAILKLDLPDRKRVALTLLRKIFVQSGHSRKESGLYRGSLEGQNLRSFVPAVLDELRSMDVIRKTRRRDTTLWEPNRVLYSRVKRILENPTTSVDPIISRF